MAELKFLVRVPMDCWRQWIRHRTASVNEYSTRYSVAIDSSQTTLPHEWRTQAEQNRQGSGAPLPDDLGQKLTEDEHHFQVLARQVYQQRLEAGVAREQARKDLPLSTYTEAYWKIDLHNLLHFLALRMDAHAQQEIRDYSATIGEKIVKPLFPVVWEAFEDYRLGGLFLSRVEMAVMQKLVSRPKPGNVWTTEDFLSVQDDTWKSLARSRERDECRSKLEQLGLLAPSSPNAAS
jgi:thymidylate synthase (FAD)